MLNADPDRLLSVREAALRLGVREGTMRAWLSERRLPRVYLGRRCIRIPERAVEAFIQTGTVPAREGS
jgi:excisionase family DNA binding protein